MQKINESGNYLLELLIFAEEKNEAKSVFEIENIIQSIRVGSIMTWKHMNFRGEYDFSEEMVSDKYGLKST